MQLHYAQKTHELVLTHRLEEAYELAVKSVNFTHGRFDRLHPVLAVNFSQYFAAEREEQSEC